MNSHRTCPQKSQRIFQFIISINNIVWNMQYSRDSESISNMPVQCRKALPRIFLFKYIQFITGFKKLEQYEFHLKLVLKFLLIYHREEGGRKKGFYKSTGLLKLLGASKVTFIRCNHSLIHPPFHTYKIIFR